MKSFFIGNKEIRLPVIQGGMGVGVSLSGLTSAFVPTVDCDASPIFKQVYIDSSQKDMMIIQSPVGMPGRAFAGANAYLSDKISSVKDVISNLKAEFMDAKLKSNF